MKCEINRNGLRRFFGAGEFEIVTSETIGEMDNVDFAISHLRKPDKLIEGRIDLGYAITGKQTVF